MTLIGSECSANMLKLLTGIVAKMNVCRPAVAYALAINILLHPQGPRRFDFYFTTSFVVGIIKCYCIVSYMKEIISTGHGAQKCPSIGFIMTRM